MLIIAAFCIENTHWQWRFAVLMGAVPMIIAVYFRWRSEETEAYQHDVKDKLPTAKERFRNICRHVWDNRVKLAGTAGSWFILDVLFYGNSLFSVRFGCGWGWGLVGWIRRVMEASDMPEF